MSFFRPFRPLLKGWLFSFLGWSAFFFALGWQMAHSFPIPTAEVVAMLGRDVLMWTLLTPLIFRLADRLPIERDRWKISLPVHLVACFATVFAFALLAHALGPKRPGPPGRGKSIGWLLFAPQLPIFLALSGVAHARYFSRRSQERERRSLELAASLADARLQALRMQIQPHFLFNSLNALAALILKDPEAADEMLTALSDFLRLTLEDSDGQEVPLRRELEFVERYLAIEKVRFGERLNFTVDVSEDTMSCLVPALLLQPLVENAVRHGIEPRRERGSIVIRARTEKGMLRLSVNDDGVGLPTAPREGVGLANTRTRLREIHGAAATLELKSEAGVRVEIDLPYRVA
jgi:two-component system, LytTR family, sensor kinase